jgi:drug/metabolite transporter (DMT)-like permease
VIYGLVAALGWGVADATGAIASRKLGSLWVVLCAQGASALLVSVAVLATGHPVGAVSTALGILLVNAVASATAYVTHYRALELGPVAVVSPVGATYALVAAILTAVALGERPAAQTIAGGLITILGVMLTSTDLGKLRAGTHGMPPGLPWAACSALGFGIGAFTLAQLSRDLGWETALWGSRCAQLVAFLGLALVSRRALAGRFRPGPAVFAALLVGGADLLGVLAYSVGTEHGFVTPVLIASAVFPVIAVGLSIALLHERPVANQYVGVALTVVGLVIVGLA